MAVLGQPGLHETNRLGAVISERGRYFRPRSPQPSLIGIGVGRTNDQPRSRRVCGPAAARLPSRSEEHTSELQSLAYLVCRLLLEKKKKKTNTIAAAID